MGLQGLDKPSRLPIPRRLSARRGIVAASAGCNSVPPDCPAGSQSFRRLLRLLCPGRPFSSALQYDLLWPACRHAGWLCTGPGGAVPVSTASSANGGHGKLYLDHCAFQCLLRFDRSCRGAQAWSLNSCNLSHVAAVH